MQDEAPSLRTPSPKQEYSSQVAVLDSQPNGTQKRGVDFWMVYVSNLMVDMLSVLDVMAVSTCLPTIVSDLNGTDFIWVGSAFTVASTAIIPFVGHLADGFGRKPILLAFILIFAVGSAICGAAQSMNMLIAGRAVQGFGGGGCLSITEIVYADMVPLAERAKFQGIIAAVWAIGCAIGPPIGGAFANSGAWRWLFYLNLPLCGLAFFLTTVFLRVHTPPFKPKEVARKMDWTGIFIIVGSTISVLIAMTWGGLRFPWSSSHVLAPLIIGACGLVAFIGYEGWDAIPKIPAMVVRWRWECKVRPALAAADLELAPVREELGLPPDYGRSPSGVLLLEPPAGKPLSENEEKYWAHVAIIRERLAPLFADQPWNPRGHPTRENLTIPEEFFLSITTLSGYLGTFFHGIVSLGAIFYLPVYFQAVRDASPVGSGVDIFPLTLTIPLAAIILGGTVKAVGGKYRVQNWIGWALCVLGFGVMSTVTEHSSRGQYIATQIPAGLGIGAIWVATQLPILAPLKVSNNAHALAFHIFLRRFAQSFGIAIGGTVIQNVLLHDLPAAYVATLPKGVEVAYAIIPTISQLDPATRDQVRHAFAQATRVVWQVMTGISAGGLLSSLPMHEKGLVGSLDTTWGLRERVKTEKIEEPL